MKEVYEMYIHIHCFSHCLFTFVDKVYRKCLCFFLQRFKNGAYRISLSHLSTSGVIVIEKILYRNVVSSFTGAQSRYFKSVFSF